ncbi:MAG: guanine deaminase [Intrasporangium sp.]|uniref:guanine deaminase n=1 Tax=Intrasporangium sp. TaxID=1925024 RepID=UPI003F813260
MTIYRGTIFDVAEDAFPGARLRADDDAGLRVVDGIITERAAFTAVRAAHPDDDVVDLRPGIVLPGFVDTHVHFPQVRIIGGLGMPLLQWLDECALPEEERLASVEYARGVAADFVRGLASAGTTTSLVFGSHFAGAVDVLFEEVARVGLRVTAGLVVSDRSLPEPLLTTPERSYEEASALAQRWHRPEGRTRYAVTPRFSYSAGDDLLDACHRVLKDVPGSWFTSHLNENPAEIAAVGAKFPTAHHYLDTYDRHGLVGRASVFAHNVHPTDGELELLGRSGAAVSHCPTSNSALGSGLFPLRRHLDHGVHVALGSDVGAGTGFSLFKEGLQSYFVQQLLGGEGTSLTSADLLHLATRSGAAALGLGEVVGDLSVGKQFDALWLCPREGGPLDVGLRHAASPEQALAKAFTLAGPADVAATWVGGDHVTSR